MSGANEVESTRKPSFNNIEPTAGTVGASEGALYPEFHKT